MAAKWIGIVVATLVSVMTGGCLVYERIDTIYLEPGGSVRWSVIHKDVRSDASSVSERESEELPYLLSVQAQTHDLARGFWQLTPTEVRARLLRSSPPYTVVTEARFPGLDVLGQRLIGRFRLDGSSVLRSTPEGTQWTLTVREPAGQDRGDEEDAALLALVPELDRLFLVLSEGRFVAAEGFEISRDGRLARFVVDPSIETKVKDRAEIVVWLRWSQILK